METVKACLDQIKGSLRTAGIESFHIDAELLLSRVMGCRKEQIYVRDMEILKAATLLELEALLCRRLGREPMAYILGTKEFYGRDFRVGPGVLVPRPETEYVVEAALEEIQNSGTEKVRVLDLGSGTGAIGISIKCERPEAEVTVVEFSDLAWPYLFENLKVLAPEINAIKTNCVSFLETNIEKFDVVVSNPPYIGAGEYLELQADVRLFEPETSLKGGFIGTEIPFRWMGLSLEALNAGGVAIFEMGYLQSQAFMNYLSERTDVGSREIRKDLAGIDRVIIARKI